MTSVAFVCLGLVGAYVAHAATRARIAHPPRRLLRKNHRGRTVPAVLGEGVVLGGSVGAALLAIAGATIWQEGPSFRVVAAVGIVVLAMGAAGSWDDHRGDEVPRGFSGHLSALRSGRLTGGIVKLLVGGLAGLVAGLMVTDGVISASLQAGLMVALSANLINLMDRAPGRALKAAGLMWVVAIPFAWGAWAVTAASSLGAAAGIARDDLRERGMLGDAGANPLGGVVGLGLFAGTTGAWRWMGIAVLAGLNLASERWSFSQIIEASPFLKRVDMLGRESS